MRAEGDREVHPLRLPGQPAKGPDSEADQSAMKPVGYLTSHKEIRDLYHSVYLLRRLPGPLPCGPQ